MKSFPNSKTKCFHSWFPKASKKLTDEYHTSSIQIFPRMILLTVPQGNVFSCSFVVSCEFTSNFPSIGEKSHEIWSFHNLFSKKQWIGKKKSQIQIWPIYIIASSRIPYFGIITCNSNSACIHVCTLAVVDDPSHANFCSMFVC